MIEWLILIESKLQPEKMVGGDVVQMKRVLREMMVCVCACVCVRVVVGVCVLAFMDGSAWV